MEAYIGQLMLFAGNFAVRNWALCEGQLLSINQYQALFSILGTTYGGDGRTTFALPDLRGRAPIGFGSGPGLTTRQLGSKSGAETETLATSQMPSHSHTVKCKSAQGTLGTPVNNYLAADREGADDVYEATSDADMNSGVIVNTGGGGAHNNMQPYLTLNYQIALTGIFPSRN